MPKVTLIIPFYNKLDKLNLVFAALERQTFRDFEVIIADDDLVGKIISNQYVIIRVDNKKYNPVFLQCFLQSEDMQRQLEKYLVGIAIRTIPVNKIREIHLPKIDLEKQKVALSMKIS